MKDKKIAKYFVVCVKNEGHSVSLETRKIYQVLPDPGAEKRNLLRIMDESGEDYLYPTEYFLRIELPQEIAQALDKAA